MDSHDISTLLPLKAWWACKTLGLKSDENLSIARHPDGLYSYANLRNTDVCLYPVSLWTVLLAFHAFFPWLPTAIIGTYKVLLIDNCVLNKAWVFSVSYKMYTCLTMVMSFSYLYGWYFKLGFITSVLDMLAVANTPHTKFHRTAKWVLVYN